MLKSKELLLKNNEREKLLTKENNQVLTDMIVYLRGSDLTELNQELVRSDLMEMVLDAQERGDDIQQVFGEDYKRICDEIISAFPKKTKKQKMLDLIDMGLACIWVLSGITAIKGFLGWWIGRNANSAIMTISIGELVNFILISVGVVALTAYFTKNVFLNEEEKERPKRIFFKRWALLSGCLLLIYGIQSCLTKEAFRIHVGFFVIITVLAFLISRKIAVLKEE